MIVAAPFAFAVTLVALELILLYCESSNRKMVRETSGRSPVPKLTWKYLAAVLFGLVHSMLRGHEVSIDNGWTVPRPACVTCRLEWTPEGRVVNRLGAR